MNFSIKELNELIYSLGITALNGRMLDKELNQSLMDKLHAELGYQMSLEVEDDDANYLTIPSEDEIYIRFCTIARRCYLYRNAGFL